MPITNKPPIPGCPHDDQLVFITQNASVTLGMLHDMAAYLLADGFDPFVAWLKAQEPDLEAHAAENNVELATNIRRHMTQLLDQVHELMNLALGEMEGHEQHH